VPKKKRESKRMRCTTQINVHAEVAALSNSSGIIDVERNSSAVIIITGGRIAAVDGMNAIRITAAPFA
jgi:hypothetical protein